MVRKITAEGAEVRRVVNRLFPLRVPLRTLRLNSLFGCSIYHVRGSPGILKSPDGGFRYLSSYNISSNIEKIGFDKWFRNTIDPCNLEGLEIARVIEPKLHAYGRDILK